MRIRDAQILIFLRELLYRRTDYTPVIYTLRGLC